VLLKIYFCCKNTNLIHFLIFINDFDIEILIYIYIYTREISGVFGNLPVILINGSRKKNVNIKKPHEQFVEAFHNWVLARSRDFRHIS
jgi:hypothetical protein